MVCEIPITSKKGDHMSHFTQLVEQWKSFDGETVDIEKELFNVPEIASLLRPYSPYIQWTTFNTVVEINPSILTAKGSIKAFGDVDSTFSVSIEETQNEQLSIIFNLNTAEEMTFRIGGISWLLFKNGLIHITGSQSGDPTPQGSISFQILVGSTWVMLQVPSLEAGNKRIFQSIQSFPISALRNLEPVYGAGRFAHKLPFTTGDAEVTLEFDEQQKQVLSVSVKLNTGSFILADRVNVANGNLNLSVHRRDAGIERNLQFNTTLSTVSGASLEMTWRYEDEQGLWKIRQSDQKSCPVNELFATIMPSISSPILEPVIISGFELDVQLGNPTPIMKGSAHISSEISVGGLIVQFTSLKLGSEQGHLQLSLAGTITVDNNMRIDIQYTFEDGTWELCGSIDDWEEISPVNQIQMSPANICWSNDSWNLTASAQWNLWELTVQAELNMHYDLSKEQFTGSLCGVADFNGFAIGVRHDGEKLTATWNGISVDYQPGMEKIIFPLHEGFTLGDLVEEGIYWVKGTRLGLSSPWDMMNDWKLPNLNLEFSLNSENRGVALSIPVQNTLKFLSEIKGLFFRFDPRLEGNKRLEFTVQLFDGKDMTWYPADPSTTPVPNLKQGVLNLEYLGLGQHVLPQGQVGRIESITQAVDLMKSSDMQTVQYDAGTGWIVASQLSLLGSINLSFVFSDPKLYGLKVQVAKNSNQYFKGLDFEILYQKVTKEIGLYQAEITLPDILRYLEFGAYSLTLPSFGIGIYTNGDFRIDIGFPRNMDFSRSCTIQTIVPPGIPFIGSAGFYINKLSEHTSTRLPEIQNGHFSTVMEFGFGMRMGLGKEIRKGPLTAGFSVTVIGILEGVLAHWHAESGGKEDYYYWLQGIAGIQGRLYGDVDLSLVKASVDVIVTVATMLTYEAYRNLEIALVAEVDINMKIKIGRKPFRISMNVSYSSSIKEQFTIEMKKKAPWDIQVQREVLEEGEQSIEPIMFFWDNLVTDAPSPLTLYMTPVLTLSPNQNSPSGLANAVVLQFSVESVAAVTVIEETEKPMTHFEQLSCRTIQWLLAASTGSTKGISVSSFSEEESFIVNRDVLRRLKKMSDNNTLVIPLEQLHKFLMSHWTITVRPSKDQCTPPGSEPTTEETCIETAFFPILPGLEISFEERIGDVKENKLKYRMDEVAKASPQYLRELASHFKDSTVETEISAHRDNQTHSAPIDMNEQSVADFVLNDYFVTIARQMIQASLDALDHYQYPVVDNTKMTEIAFFIETGTKAISSGLGPTEDKLANIIEYLFEQNKTIPLRVGLELSLEGVKYSLPPDEKWENIVNRFNFNDVLTFVLKVLEIKENMSKVGLFKAGTIENADSTKSPLNIELEDSPKDVLRKAGLTSMSEIVANYPQIMLQESIEIMIPPFLYSVKDQDTLQMLSQQFNLSYMQLARQTSIQQADKLFNVSALEIGPLKKLEFFEMFKHIRKHQALLQLSGMVSRSFLHGMRLSAGEGLRVLKHLENQSSYGLFELTGQQVELEDMGSPEGWIISLDNKSESGGWNTIIIEEEVDFA